MNQIVMEELKREAEAAVKHRLPRDTFLDFAHPNNRLLVGVTCLRAGLPDLAYKLFQSIAEEGPNENPNQHFAYVRSLVEMAELDAEAQRFNQAAEKMKEALAQYPETMGYMMSRVHLEVYLAYYLYQAGQKQEAVEKIAGIAGREREKFATMPQHDAVALVGPGLCYALHQWALFYAMEENWEQAAQKAAEMVPFAERVDESGLKEAKQLLERGRAEDAFRRTIDSINY
ncbi:hypothetical protein H1164_16655 [Thermoactinomyces daqus]|jgi:tetratricopeptide (TPR) repeat protein|uniref:Tetratricopeptide repeat protein n=1 Tax=Thermoactinomyces daqus TaxID=1329516 RepID=A0A7W1XD82_9BACL|nr:MULTISPECIES: hypothetical protein [Thermoactinomyces]MBA4544466.1 hypothetical protein [Thermoactinomyces daqus]MBH8605024.1 hypothetical protein [Thermoactinomyces sp. CICC 10522]